MTSGLCARCRHSVRWHKTEACSLTGCACPALISDLSEVPEKPQTVLIGDLPGGQQVLITVWSDGGEIAFRSNTQVRWGVPIPLAQAEEEE